MAKSLRAKTRQAAGRKKRADGHYAVAEAARVHRLSAKLLGKGKGKDKDDKSSPQGEDDQGVDEDGDVNVDDAEAGAEATPVKVSTSGPRGSRREKWRQSKGMPTKRAGKRGEGGPNSGHKPKRRR